MMRYVNAHEPAMLPQEAALLPATTVMTQTVQRPNILWPRQEEHFRAFEVGDEVVRVPDQPVRNTGSAAGRAVLSAAGISMPGVSGMRRGCQRAQDRQTKCYRYVCESEPCSTLELL